MKALLALTIATSYGLTLRMLFGFISPGMEIMSLTFLGLVPVVIGFLTVRFWPEDKVKTSLQAFGRPWLTSLAILFITILVQIEGAICWIMIYPFFSIAAGIGGIFAYKVRERNKIPRDHPDILDEDWNDSSNLKLSLFLLLPLLLGYIESDHTTTRRDMQQSATITIDAPATAVWAAITEIGRVDHAEKGTHLTDLIGFPAHLYTTLDTCALGGQRVAHYQGGLFFTETIKELQPQRKLVLDIHVDPDKVPPTVLDEHIVIGGKHVDVLQDTYLLTENADGGTQVELTSEYFINTPFNWYAGIWAQVLLSELLHGELRMIKGRVE